MISLRVALLALLASIAPTGSARAYFVIELTTGGELHADFVREEADWIRAARATGEVRIERSRVRAVREVEPGAKFGVTEGVLEGAPSPALEPGPDAAEREAEVVRQIILQRRDFLFARLRGDAPADLAKREHELNELKSERAAIQKLTPSSPR